MAPLEKLLAIAITSTFIFAFGAYKDIQAEKRFTTAIKNARLVDVNSDGKLDIYFSEQGKTFLNTYGGFVCSTNKYSIGGRK
jgi:hypothetical protein